MDEFLLTLDASPIIPSNENEDRDARPVKFDRDSYKRRYIIARLISRLKECRQVFS